MIWDMILVEKMEKINELSLIETIELMKKYSDAGYEVYFSGEKGKVKAVAEAVFIINKK